MPKITILRGLPASGKSTWALLQLLENPRAVRLNNDTFREALYGFRKWNAKDEQKMFHWIEGLAGEALRDGMDLLVDNTNLNEKTLQRWLEFAPGVSREIKIFPLSPQECVLRDLWRPPSQQVGPGVIWSMALRNHWQLPWEAEGEEKKPLVLCDLDGTIADQTHRKHFLEEKNHDDYFSMRAILRDSPIEGNILKVKEFAEKNKAMVIFVSGRRGDKDCSEATYQWLLTHWGFHEPGFLVTPSQVPLVPLLMRQNGDLRPDFVIKEGILRALPGERILRVYDDRPSVIRMWRNKGLEVVDCGDGREF